MFWNLCTQKGACPRPRSLWTGTVSTQVPSPLPSACRVRSNHILLVFRTWLSCHFPSIPAAFRPCPPRFPSPPSFLPQPPHSPHTRLLRHLPSSLKLVSISVSAFRPPLPCLCLQHDSLSPCSVPAALRDSGFMEVNRPGLRPRGGSRDTARRPGGGAGPGRGVRERGVFRGADQVFGTARGAGVGKEVGAVLV